MTYFVRQYLITKCICVLDGLPSLNYLSFSLTALTFTGVYWPIGTAPSISAGPIQPGGYQTGMLL